MDLKMANDTSSQTEEYWSEHLLSKFGLEYIKHDVLFKKSMYEENIDIPKARAIQNLAQVLQIEANEKNVTEKCNKFRKEIFFLLRQVVRRFMLIGWDMKNRWQLEFAHLLLPPWLREVETELIMLPQAVTEELRESETMESVLKTKFKRQLREAAAVGIARGNTFEARDFKKISTYYNISVTETLNIWGDLFSQARRRILQEVQCKEGIREVDSELTDLLLLYDHTFSIVTLESLSHQKQLQNLTHLCQIMLIQDVENVLRNDRPRLLEVWIQALSTYLMSYPFSLGFSSAVYVQRMWYELKQLARRQVLIFHLGHDQQPPNPLLLSIVAKHIVEEPMPTWNDYVKSKMVVKLKDISRTLAKNVLKSMNELYEARKQAEMRISSLNRSKQIYIVPPLNNEAQTNKSNEITENNSIAIIDNESQSNKSDLNINDTNKDNKINKNEFVASTNSNVAKNTDNLITLKNTMKLNTILNNIDPTKAHKSVILDSDSDSETISNSQIDKHLNRNKEVRETKCDLDISKKSQDSKVNMKETDGKPINENPPLKLNGDNIKIDFKLIKNLTIPLIRCDIQPSKKHTNKNIKINNKNNESLKNKTLRTQRELRSFSNNSIYWKNITLNGLSEKFLKNDKNRCLFKMCKPISVKLERVKDERICRRTKKVKLADIEEVRKINSTILTAEVAPVSINRFDPPAEASSVGIFNEESIPEISKSTFINSFELDNLFNRLPPPPLKPMNVDNPIDKENTCSTHCVDLEQNKTNKSYFTEQKFHDDLNNKVLSIIRKCPAALQKKLPTTTVEDSENDIKLSSITNEIKDKNKKRQNKEIKQNQVKKKKKKSKRRNSECNEIISNDPLEEWHRQKNLNKKYFQLPNIAPKPVESEKSNTSDKTNKISNTNITNLSTSNPVVDLTEISDDTLENSVNTPIITNVFSLAETNERKKVPQNVISPILLPEKNINSHLATLTKVKSNVGSRDLPQVNKVMSVSVAGKQFVVQKSAGRRFVIIPQAELMNEKTPLLLSSNVKIVNASVTANPVDHIQRMIVPNRTPEIETPHQLQLMPWVPLELWVQGKSDSELVILQVNSSKPTWTMNGGQSIVTLTDNACDKPVYCSLPIQVKTRIIFPEENNGTAVYNPPTLQIYEESANGNTPFAKWVKSVVNTKYTNHSTYINDKGMTQDTSSKIKVKSFAKMTKTSDNFAAPSRVCLQDSLYMKVCEQPLKYAKVITALSSLDEFHNLLLEDAPLKLLPKDVTHFDSLQSLNNLKDSFIWPLSRYSKC